MKKILSILLFLFAFSAQAQVSNGVVPVIVSGAQTATTVNSPIQANPGRKCAHVVINVSAYTSGTYTPTVQGYDSVSNVYYTIVTGTAIGATGTTVLRICPAITVVANSSVSDMLPGAWRVQLAGASTPSMTLSVEALLDY